VCAGSCVHILSCVHQLQEEKTLKFKMYLSVCVCVCVRFGVTVRSYPRLPQIYLSAADDLTSPLTLAVTSLAMTHDVLF